MTIEIAIRVKDLSFSYPPPVPQGERVVLFSGLTFDVKAGTCVGVMGANGVGKTTLCLALAGLAPRLTGGRLAGQITVTERDVQAERPGGLADVVGVMLQNPVGQLFNASVEAEIAWGLENLGIPRQEMLRRVEWALAAVGLDVPPDRPPDRLSGGQQKRLALAAALALQPRVLILDEPIGGLDPVGRREVVETLARLRAQNGLTILFTESDAESVAALADRVLVLDGGTLVMDSPVREALSRVEALEAIGLDAPPAARLAARLNAASGLDYQFLTLEEARAALSHSARIQGAHTRE